MPMMIMGGMDFGVKPDGSFKGSAEFNVLGVVGAGFEAG